VSIYNTSRGSTDNTTDESDEHEYPDVIRLSQRETRKSDYYGVQANIISKIKASGVIQEALKQPWEGTLDRGNDQSLQANKVCDLVPSTKLSTVNGYSGSIWSSRSVQGLLVCLEMYIYSKSQDWLWSLLANRIIWGAVILTVSNGMKFYRMDVKTALLNGELNVVVYMSQFEEKELIMDWNSHLAVGILLFTYLSHFCCCVHWLHCNLTQNWWREKHCWSIRGKGFGGNCILITYWHSKFSPQNLLVIRPSFRKWLKRGKIKLAILALLYKLQDSTEKWPGVYLCPGPVTYVHCYHIFWGTCDVKFHSRSFWNFLVASDAFWGTWQWCTALVNIYFTLLDLKIVSGAFWGTWHSRIFWAAFDAFWSTLILLLKI